MDNIKYITYDKINNLPIIYCANALPISIIISSRFFKGKTYEKPQQTCDNNLEKDNPMQIDIDSIKNTSDTDYYSLLGISKLNMYASLEQITSAYRKVSLIFHPDKIKIYESSEPKYIELYKNIQTAYEILSNITTKRIYDSLLPFDNTIPTLLDIKKKDFFELFEPIFKRNAVFSLQYPNIPKIGDINTEYVKVESFYNFWLSFKSWREFALSEEDEEDLEIDVDAPRYERRWVQQDRERLMKKSKKIESQRIRSLVDLAMCYDPRIIREKELLKKKEKKQPLQNKLTKQQAKFKEEQELINKRQKELKAKFANIKRK
jgi:DnaJ homolog subfamily C member 2